ncbi:MAG: hypothetical protein ACK4YO_03130, partial [Candidatus Altarchaeaceae archaeon]
ALNPKNFNVNSTFNSIEKVINVVEEGLELFEFLGVGGMGTRGFGRLKILNLKNTENNKNGNKQQNQP